MKKSQRSRKPRKPIIHSTPDFAAALKSFLGYLEGTEKSLHTVKDYRLDLLSFDRFLRESLVLKSPSLAKIAPKDIERFHDWLRAQGLKSNTRRRQLLTVQAFLRYLSRRKKVPELLARKIPTPQKIERIPATVPLPELVTAIRALPAGTLLDARNRLLLWTLAETGCLVSEIALIQETSFSENQLRILGKSPRTVPVSAELAQASREFAAMKKSASGPLFEGFNRFGSMGAAISPRGVELLVRHFAARLGFPDLTPRTFRHSAVVHWLKQGTTQIEARERLGLKSDYAFRTYARLAPHTPPTTPRPSSTDFQGD